MQFVWKCMLLSHNTVGNSAVYLWFLCHVHIISEDVREREDISLLQVGSIHVVNLLRGSNLKYFDSADCTCDDRLLTVSLKPTRLTPTDITYLK